ncbi:MAG: hypothetical protein ACTSPG_06870 [Candidatus Hodarchaeales archaeon]
MIKYFEPIIEDVIKWSTILTGISFCLTLLSILISIDITQDSIAYLSLFATAMSNFSFFFGVITMGAGLLIAFFKPPTHRVENKENKKVFTPKYKRKEDKRPVKKPIVTKEESPPFLTVKEKKLVFTGLVLILIALVIWIAFLVIDLVLP